MLWSKGKAVPNWLLPGEGPPEPILIKELACDIVTRNSDICGMDVGIE